MHHCRFDDLEVDHLIRVRADQFQLPGMFGEVAEATKDQHVL
jgi:hypothetical protein